MQLLVWEELEYEVVDTVEVEVGEKAVVLEDSLEELIVDMTAVDCEVKERPLVLEVV